MAGEDATGFDWTGPETGSQHIPDLTLRVETLEGITPFDAQFGAANKKNVPAALVDLLFGPPQSPEDTAQTVAAYAVVDAALVTGLADLLEVSGQEHRCLFQGRALDEMKDAAPWLVALNAKSDFTRSLFTESDAPWHLWGKDAYILFRSPAPFDQVYAHLRRKMRIVDTQNKAFFFRFWDPLQILTFLTAPSATPADKRWLLSDHRGLVMSEVFCVMDGTCTHITSPAETGRNAHSFRLSEPLRATFAASVARRIREKDIAAVQSVFPQAPAELLDQERSRLLALGFRRPAPIRAALCLCAQRSAPVTALSAVEQEILNATRLSDLARIRLLRRAIGDWPQAVEVAL